VEQRYLLPADGTAVLSNAISDLTKNGLLPP
jgi:hypothetical protein